MPLSVACQEALTPAAYSNLTRFIFSGDFLREDTLTPGAECLEVLLAGSGLRGEAVSQRTKR